MGFLAWEMNQVRDKRPDHVNDKQEAERNETVESGPGCPTSREEQASFEKERRKIQQESTLHHNPFFFKIASIQMPIHSVPERYKGHQKCHERREPNEDFTTLE